jgi:UDP:flavonoid glycosyltransferase YjiC (YdhE family)
VKFLFVPGNNSLSHAAKCLAVRERLVSGGHECLIAVTRDNSSFLKSQGCEHVILPDIQESDGAGFPSISWFADQQRIIQCIKAEVDLLKSYRPDRVIGVFRFTIKVSAHLTGIPYDSLICGCMIPYSQTTLGVGDCGRGAVQNHDIDMFFFSAGQKFNRALAHFDIDKIIDIRETLIGDHTFLWDFPEFSPVSEKSGLIHIGPLSWNRWPYDIVDMDSIVNGGSPLAVISFGTCATKIAITKRMIRVLVDKRMIRVLVDMGYRVIVAGGGKISSGELLPEEKGVTVCRFAPLQRIFPHASLIISHGGQMTVFEALCNRVPVVVMPFQPEQAHNGICLEQIGCGRLLVPSKTFVGSSSIYTDALDRMSDEDIKSDILSLVGNPETEKCLSRISDVLVRYHGPETMASILTQ